MDPLWSWILSEGVGYLYSENLRLMMGRVVEGHGIPWDFSRELPWDSSGNFEGIPTGPHGTPWGAVLFLWYPAATSGITYGILWVPVERPMGCRGSPMGSRGLLRDLLGISRGPTGNHTTMKTTAKVTPGQRNTHKWDCIRMYWVGQTPSVRVLMP